MISKEFARIILIVIYLEMKNKIFLLTRQMLFFLLFFLCAFLVSQPEANAQQRLNEATRVQPQDIRRLTVPPELLRQTLVAVPRLEGRTYNQQELEQILERTGLAMGNTLPVINNERIGIIISQTPAAGQRVQRGTPVNITYGIQGGVVTPNQPNENVSVPDYVGMTLQRATGRMPNDRLQPGSIKETPSDAPAGIVVDQFPEAGMIVDPGTRIDFAVSSGPQSVTQIAVPNLLGLTLEQAANVLRESKLFAGQLREEISDARPGVVMSQSPRAGTLVPLESAVDITFSVSPPEERDVVVPDVKGLPVDKAIQVIKESRLNYLLKYEKRQGEHQNIVVEQEPLPETRVPPGTNVQLIIPKEETLPPWVYWGGGVLVAAILGGFVGRKIGGRKNKTMGKKDTTLHLKPVLDGGKQSITSKDTGIIQQQLHIKPVPDKGTQTIKTN